MSEPATLIACLERAAESKHGVRFLASRGDVFVSYREIHERARRVAGGVRSLGIEPGDRVAVALPTSVEFYEAFFGVLAAGATPVPLALPPRLGAVDGYEATTRAMLGAASAKLVLASSSARLPRIVSGSSPGIELRRLEELPRSLVSGIESSADELALVQFSSGTTASPKPVSLTHRQILANVRAILRRFFDAYPEGSGHEHGGVSWLPLHHDMGLIGAVLTALVHPGPLALMSPEAFVARPARWLQAISSYRASVSAAPHFAYELCADRIRDEELAGVDLSSWLFALDGAEAVTPTVLERFFERFRRFGLREEALTPVYGLAEAGLAVTFAEPRTRFSARTFDRDALVHRDRAVPASAGQKLVSCGVPLPGFELRIEDPDGARLPEARVGRIVVRGPSIMRGYLDQPAATREVLRDGWLDTGDRGFLLEGELFVCGRYKDCLVLRGRNYAPEFIEQTVDGVSGLRPGSVAAVGVLTDDGERLWLLAERSVGSKAPRSSELEEAVRVRTTEGVGVTPDRVVILEPGALPRTRSGKIRRQEAARRFVHARKRLRDNG